MFERMTSSGVADPPLRRHEGGAQLPDRRARAREPARGRCRGRRRRAAELRWPGGDALVFGSTKHADGVHGHLPSGAAGLSVVTDDVDEVHDRVRSAGGAIVQPPHETRVGPGASAYASTAVDQDGNLWTFGTYRGHG